MRTFLFECKKILRHHFGLALILLYAVAALSLMILTDVPYNAKIEDAEKSYLRYMEKLSGPLTDEKAEFIDREDDVIADTQARREALYEQYYAGAMDESVLRSGLAELEQVLSRAPAYEIIYEQYQYISGDKENRYFLPTNGWNALLAISDADILLLLTILLLLIPIFCGEYDCQMELLLMTSRNGRKDMWLKLLLAMLAVLVLCGFTYLSRYLLCLTKYGLPNAVYPLQSLSYFGGCEKSISLLQAYLAICALKTVGFQYFSAMVLAFSVLLRGYAPTVFLSAASVFLPYFAFAPEQYSRAPIPLSFMMATNYFLGPKLNMNYATGVPEVLYAELSWAELALLIAVGSAAIAMCVLCVLLRNRNHWQHVKKGRSKAKTIMLLICLTALLPFCGCAESGEASGEAYFNCNASAAYVSEDYIVTSDVSSSTITVTNRKTGETYDLDREPVSELSSITATGVASVFGRGNTVYYLMLYKGMLQVREVRLVAMEERIVFEKPLRSTIDFLGLTIDANTKWSDFRNVMGVFADNDFFYFTFSSNTFNGIRRVDRHTLAVTPLDVPLVNAFFDGVYYYYLDDVGVLTKYDLHTQNASPISSVVATACYFYRNRLYYLNRLENNQVYSCNADGSAQKSETAERCISIMFRNDALVAMPVSGENIILTEP
ncbi:MAG TPA: hypothetical protein VN608_10550 [Clostridia bacterium]|nr:hypothetical protein [Clostridia bacterium]